MKTKKEVEAIVSAMGVFQSFISNLVELVKKFGGSVENIYRLVTPEGAETLEAIARIIVDRASGVRNGFLKLISGNEPLILDACDGTQTLADAKDMFTLISLDFRNCGADEKGPTTEETAVDVYKMTENATFLQMFGSLRSDVRKLCLSQHQIKMFIKKYRKWLQAEGHTTFFLFKSNNNLFVAGVNFFCSNDSLRVDVYQFESLCIWYAEYCHRVVVPHLA